ncbi:hypothetical protein TGAM01_v201682 [Trichoderma gamsii]|uniref:Uncharacterized protein n=1 Tax=Trichoderma gamsii TaxID=398673 RepID=A0A2P4ZYU3_9HYPO|nr:hypothetical protein TGAM01_v201682 [Trichoderma gamsii]PON29433.1 hypothetical protein TGAM01_v201682 [Trichoderma gamsii]
MYSMFVSKCECESRVDKNQTIHAVCPPITTLYSSHHVRNASDGELLMLLLLLLGVAGNSPE